MKGRLGRGTAWSRRAIEAEQARIKGELDACPGGHRARLYLALSRIRELESAGDAAGLLSRYIYVVSALVHHRRFGGLTGSQVKRLLGLGELILRLQGVRPARSKLGFLYGDLFLAASNIHYVRGDLWRAAWEQQLSFLMSRRAVTGGKGFQALATAVQLFRLGDVPRGSELVHRARTLGVPPELEARLRVEEVKARRLLGRPEEGLALASAGAEGLALGWERLLCEAALSRELRPLVAAVLPGKPHHQAHYVLEAFLWSRLPKERDLLSRVPHPRKLAPDLALDRKSGGFLFRAAECIERCYDEAIPLFLRLRQLGEILSDRGRLLNLEWELLLWGAAARWLARRRVSGFSVVALAEYEALSLRVTAGRTKDCLGWLGDLTGEGEVAPAEAA